jgi:enoyl-CoA hydratase
MSDDPAIYEVRNGIAVITLNRPEKLNAISIAMADALKDIWEQFENDEDAKVAILRGEGTAFSVGADIKEPRPKTGIPWAIRIHRAFPLNGTKIFKPIVGAVQGYAYGAGWILAVNGCDITIAGESARFGYPEPRAGMPAAVTEYVPGYLPFKASLEFHMLAWEGDAILDAHRALELHVVNRVVPDADLMAEATRWAELLKRIPPHYVRGLKRGHYRSAIRADRAVEADYLDYVWPYLSSSDYEESLNAVKEKREPTYTGH